MPEFTEVIGPAGWASMHDATVCDRINNTAQFHTKSWSYRFTCPSCGATRRYNTNFLGSRYRLVCDGKSITRQKKEAR